MLVKNKLNEGFSFGITSGVITTLGLLVGLATSTHSKLAVIGGILSIALADSLSDSMGIHVAEETKNEMSGADLWKTTVSTLITKFLTALTFVIPVIKFSLYNATIISFAWGILLIGVLSYFIAKNNNESPLKVIFEHIVICSIVVGASATLGNFISNYFNY